MRTKLSGILLSLLVAACSRSHAPRAADTVPPAPEFAEQRGDTVVESSDMSASAGDKAILPEDQIFFPNDSSALDADGKKLLAEVATWVMAEPGRQIVIEGHADTTGSKDYNLDLSSRRALAVANHLRSLNVTDDRIVVTAFGESDAHLAPGSVNRRVLIFATATATSATLTGSDAMITSLR